jgi:hypothetical protein
MQQDNGSTRHQPWPPSTEEDLRHAAANGAFEERHTIDIKRELPPGDSANKELAKDLASFAIDGGRLIYGIDESAGFALTPIDLRGLAERIDLVAHSRVDEPLDVEFTAIRTASDPDRGYLVVSIPVSPRAPHMAGNRYYGRSDKGKYPLGDALATQLIERRKQWAVAPDGMLDEWIARDPVPVGEQKLGHLHMVAIPVPRRDEFMLPLFTGDWRSRLNQFLAEAHRPGEGFSPDLGLAAAYGARTPRGWAIASRELDASGRLDWRQENAFIELEVTEDGPVFLRSGRAVDFTDGGKKLVIEIACLGLPYRMVSLTARLSTALDFSGNWDFALAITNLNGAISYLRPFVGLQFNHPVYREYLYRASTRASGQEIKGRPGAIVNRLLGRLMRAIGIDQAPKLQELMGREVPVQSTSSGP